MLHMGALWGQAERAEVSVCLSAARGNALALPWNLSSAACCTDSASHSEAKPRILFLSLRSAAEALASGAIVWSRSG